MLNNESAVNIIKDTFETLRRSGIIASGTDFSKEMVILGSNSNLDSLGFVSFISDLEERLSAQYERDIFLVLNDIGDFNMNNPSLTVQVLASYLVGLMRTEG
jgi:acyl carrier protein